MGYTIYIYYSEFTDDEWTELLKRTKKMLDETNIPVTSGDGKAGGEPNLNDTYISFNGVEEDSHETAYLTKKPAKKPWALEEKLCFDFCKTARKPYDSLVMELFLNALDILGPERCRVSNDDGYSSDPKNYDEDDDVPLVPHSNGVHFPQFKNLLHILNL
jgi:hypothetical protein